MRSNASSSETMTDKQKQQPATDNRQRRNITPPAERFSSTSFVQNKVRHRMAMTTFLDLKFGLRGGTNRSRDVEDVAELAPVMNKVPRASVVKFLYDLGLSIQPVDRGRDDRI